MAPPQGNPSAAAATVSVNNIGALDLLQAAISGLEPGQNYTLWLANTRTSLYTGKVQLAKFKTNLSGAQVLQAVGPLRQELGTNTTTPTAPMQKRFLIITPADNDGIDLLQIEKALP